MRRQRQFDIAGEFQMPGPQRTVGDRQAPQFGIVFCGHRNIQDGLNAGHAPVDFGAIRGKPDQ